LEHDSLSIGAPYGSVNKSSQETCHGVNGRIIFLMQRAVAASAAVLLALAYLYARRRRQAAVSVYRASTRDARAHAEGIFNLVNKCFPGHFDDEDKCDICGCLCGFHDEDRAAWLLVFDPEYRLCALSLIVPYHDRLYISSLCVAPRYQRQGLGTLLLRSASAYAKECLHLDRVSGSVAVTELTAERLQRYYERLGGKAEPPPPMQGSAPTTLRLDALSGAPTSAGVPPPTPLHSFARRSSEP
jgi:ribosomal protein S18 acetylase RimI-like enzyme